MGAFQMLGFAVMVKHKLSYREASAVHVLASCCCTKSHHAHPLALISLLSILPLWKYIERELAKIHSPVLSMWSAGTTTIPDTQDML